MWAGRFYRTIFSFTCLVAFAACDDRVPFSSPSTTSAALASAAKVSKQQVTGTCSVSQTSTGATISCADGSQANLVNGANGATGLTGAPGAAGVVGPIGSTGPQGLQGVQGIAGNPLRLRLLNSTGTVISNNVISASIGSVTVLDPGTHGFANYYAGSSFLGETQGPLENTIFYFEGSGCTGSAYAYIFGTHPFSSHWIVGSSNSGIFQTTHTNSAPVTIHSSVNDGMGNNTPCTERSAETFSAHKLTGAVPYSGSLPASIGLNWSVESY